jgi:acyl carrier protein
MLKNISHIKKIVRSVLVIEEGRKENLEKMLENPKANLMLSSVQIVHLITELEKEFEINVVEDDLVNTRYFNSLESILEYLKKEHNINI